MGPDTPTVAPHSALAWWPIEGSLPEHPRPTEPRLGAAALSGASYRCRPGHDTQPRERGLSDLSSGGDLVARGLLPHERGRPPAHRARGRTEVRRGSADPLGLVLDLERDLLQLVGVLLAVVCTEEEVKSAGERNSHVGLRAASITAICRGQGGFFDDCSAHDGLSFMMTNLWCSEVLLSALSTTYVYTTSNPASNVPFACLSLVNLV